MDQPKRHGVRRIGARRFQPRRGRREPVAAHTLNRGGEGRSDLATGAVVATVAGIAAFHVLDHKLIPERRHVISHPAAGVVSVIAARSAGLSWEELGLAPSSVARGLLFGTVHGVGALVVVGLGSLLPHIAPMLEDDRLEATVEGSLGFPTLVEIPLSTALYEELVFRGALLGLLTHRLGEVGGAAAAAGLFGLWHVLPALEDRKHNPMYLDRHPAKTVLPAVAGTTVAGLWFGWLRKRSGSVLAPMLVHAFTNSGALASATLVSRRRRRRATDEPRGSLP